MNMHKQLAAMPDFYSEVLINERSLIIATCSVPSTLSSMH